jgi:glycyl-tRNA synthetase alpha chain
LRLSGGKDLSFQELIQRLLSFWTEKGCAQLHPYNVSEVGAATFNPATFFGVLSKREWNVVYVEPCKRPGDGRYAENPNRLQYYYQMQVILKPAPPQVQDIYLESLESVGIDKRLHDIRFVEDDWESPTLGAWGRGWEVRLDGLEITQFTYFQQMGGVDLLHVPCEITYGLERIALFVQKKEDIFQIEWAKGLSYGSLHKEAERQHCIYNFDCADINTLFSLFSLYEKEAWSLLERGLFLPAYDWVLKCSHTFNMLDARGALSWQERQNYVARIRKLAKEVAESFLKHEASCL